MESHRNDSIVRQSGVPLLAVITLIIVGVVLGAIASWAILVGGIDAATPWIDRTLHFVLPALGILAAMLAVVLPFTFWALKRFVGSARGTLDQVVRDVGAAVRAQNAGDGAAAITNSENAILEIVAWYTPIASRRWVVQTAFALLVSFGGLIGTALIFRQTVLLGEQNKKLQEQTTLLGEQNKLIVEQNNKLDLQTITADAQRRTTLTAELFSILQTISLLKGEPKPALLARIVAFSRAAVAYWTIEVSINVRTEEFVPKLEERSRSPERGQLLIGLIGADVNLTELRAVFDDADLRGVTFDNLNLSSGRLNRADLGGATISNSTLQSAKLGSANMRRVTLSNTDMTDANLQSAELAGLRCNGTNFSKARLTEANFRDSRFDACNFHNASVGRANFAESEFVSVNFEGADLSGSKFDDAHFQDSNMKNAFLEGVDFRGAKFVGQMDWDGAILASDAEKPLLEHLPAGWSAPPDGWKLVREEIPTSWSLPLDRLKLRPALRPTDRLIVLRRK